MSITQNGNTLTWDGTVTITNATDITTGVATLMLTPLGGVGTLPVLAQGQPGLPPVIDSVSVTQVAFGTSLAAPVLTTVSTGGPGVASHYTLAFQVNQGPPGTAGTFTLAGATDADISGPTDHQTLVFKATNNQWNNVGQLCGDTYQTTTFTAASGNTSPQTLGTITVPAQPFNWRPDCRGFAIPSGTANTHVDLQVLLNNQTTGQQVAYGWGNTGAGVTVPATAVSLNQAFAGTISSGYGLISAGSAAPFFFQAVQTATTTNSFSVPTSPMYFTVKVDPVPATN